MVLSCNEEPIYQIRSSVVASEELLDSAIIVTLNPNALTPLAAEVKLNTLRPSDVTISLVEDPSVRFLSENKLEHSFELVGLFADTQNEIEIKINTTDSLFRASTVEFIQTDPLPDFFPDIEIVTSDLDKMENGWNLVEMNIGSEDGFQFYPIVFDAQGRVRYYIDLSHVQGWIGPIVFTEDKRWMFGQGNSLKKYDLLLNEIEGYDLAAFGLHHDFTIKDNGNLLICASRLNSDTSLDHLIEFDPSSFSIVKTWDSREYLDVDRNEMNWNSNDWFHNNSIHYDEEDRVQILSGRYQGVYAVDDLDYLLWIMAPHKGWENAGPNGDGLDTRNYLLTAVDENDVPYPEPVQLGLEDAPGFSWTWGQHACMSTEDGNLLCFDNGWKTNFNGDAGFSRIVEYQIDPTVLTIRQVWEYGRERGVDLHSTNLSDVDILPNTKNRLMIPGNIRDAAFRHARMVEIAYPSKELVFEAIIRFKNSLSTGNNWTQSDLVYQGERVVLLN